MLLINRNVARSHLLQNPLIKRPPQALQRIAVGKDVQHLNWQRDPGLVEAVREVKAGSPAERGQDSL